MSNDYTPTVPLSAADVALIKRAARPSKNENLLDYSIVPQVNGDKASVGICVDGVVTLYKGAVATPVSQRVEIPALRSVTDYGSKPSLTVSSRRFVCSYKAYRTSPESNPFITLSSLVKVGDELRVRFVLANNTEALKAAGFQYDSCFIDVFRGRTFVGSVFITSQTVPDNNYFAGYVDPSWKGESWSLTSEVAS